MRIGCPRLSHKKHRRVNGIIISILLLILITEFIQRSRTPCNYATADHLLDLCMMDGTPCFPNIERSIDRFFPTLKTKFPTLLTYHPTIDCDHGRYLLLNDAPDSHVIHGTGSQLMWYLGVLNIAHALNLTLIHLEWTAEHAYDEKNADREKYWQFSDWEIPYTAYLACPKLSAVRKNKLIYDLYPNQTFDVYLDEKKVFTIKPTLATLFNRFVTNVGQGNGFTFYARRTLTITSSLIELGAVFEARWWLQHRKLYNDPSGVWSGDRKSSNYVPTDYFQFSKLMKQETSSGVRCRPISTHDHLLIGVHIRRGDVLKRDKDGNIISADLYRYISDSAYVPLIQTIINQLEIEFKDKYLITIYSEGKVSDFMNILETLKNTVRNSRCRISFFLNGRTSDTFNRLLRDDVIVVSHSTFSMAAGIFNSRQLKIGPRHNRARVHGMRNFLRLQLNNQHTRFNITDREKRLIRNRINHVWQQKQRQQKTPFPLWIQNYDQHYPEDFMLL